MVWCKPSDRASSADVRTDRSQHDIDQWSRGDAPREAPGRGGGFTYATPPSGQSTIWSAFPPTWRQASAWPNSWSITIRNRTDTRARSR